MDSLPESGNQSAKQDAGSGGWILANVAILTSHFCDTYVKKAKFLICNKNIMTDGRACLRGTDHPIES